MPAPHRVVDNALDGLADGVSNVIRGLGDGVKGAGNSLMTALDGPPKDVLGVGGPHRIVDRALNGMVDAAVNTWTNGVVNSLKIVGEGYAKALDHPVEQFGVPPELGKLPGRPKILG